MARLASAYKSHHLVPEPSLALLGKLAPSHRSAIRASPLRIPRLRLVPFPLSRALSPRRCLRVHETRLNFNNLRVWQSPTPGIWPLVISRPSPRTQEVTVQDTPERLVITTRSRRSFLDEHTQMVAW